MNELTQRVSNIIKCVCKDLYDREDVVRIVVLTILAGQNVFLFGPPGTGKSMISRKVAGIFENSKYYEHLMHRFCTPEELFGPVSLKQLKNDQYVRLTEGYLASADFAFLDEIWKSSPAVLNTLLTLINERKFHNGSETLKVPLKSLISASNEIPLHEAGLDALYDRFLVRLTVNPIRDSATFRKLITGSTAGSSSEIPKKLRITNEEYELWLSQIEQVKLSETNAEAIVRMREIIAEQVDLSDLDGKLDNTFDEDADQDVLSDDQKYGHLSYVSDRRWFQIVRLLKASAFYNGRTETSIKDFFILRYCLWNNASDQGSFDRLVTDIIKQYAQQDLVSDELRRTIETEFSEHGISFCEDMVRQISTIEKEIDKIRSKLKENDVEIRGGDRQLFFRQNSDLTPKFNRFPKPSAINKVNFESYITEMHIEPGMEVDCTVTKTPNRGFKLYLNQLECFPDDEFFNSQVSNGQRIKMKIYAVDRENRLIWVRTIRKTAEYWLPILNYDLDIVYRSIYNEQLVRSPSLSFKLSANEQGNFVLTIMGQNTKQQHIIKKESINLLLMLIKQFNRRGEFEEKIMNYFNEYDRLFEKIIHEIDEEIFLNNDDKRCLKEIFFDLIPNIRKAKNDFLELQNVYSK